MNMSLQLDNVTRQGMSTTAWTPVCHMAYTRDTWVKLLALPSEYASDEAKLLCQESVNTWVAWVPSHGEIRLDRSEFYC